MSLFGTLNTAVSGMSAQANMLGTIGDNIANSGTTGYKQATIDFETQLGTQSASSYTAGGVQSAVRYGIGDQGTLTSTTSATDLAVQGDGFFVVQDSNGNTALTRAGSFVPNAAGNLVNTAGYELMGYNLTDGSSATANGVGGLQVINLSKQSLSASPSTTGTINFNLSVQCRDGDGRHAGLQRRRRDLYVEDVGCRLRQSRQPGDARRLLYQDRRQHLGGHHLQPSQRGLGRRLSLRQ